MAASLTDFNPARMFESFSDDSRLWVFMTSEEIPDRLIGTIEAEVTAFLREWTTHGSPLSAACEIANQHCVLVALRSQNVAASGCAIDALSRQIEKILTSFQLSQLRHSHVLMAQADGFVPVALSELSQLAARGAVTKDTVVLNTVVSTVGDLRAGKWAVRLADSPFAARISNK